MSHNYGLRHHSVELSDAAMETEGNAVMSSPGPHSSSYLPSVDLGAPPHLSFTQLDPNFLDDDNNPAYRSSPPPVQYRTDKEKTIEILAALRGLSRFSLQKFSRDGLYLRRIDNKNFRGYLLSRWRASFLAYYMLAAGRDAAVGDDFDEG
ncbi:hypothetical protein B0H14DRAFT_3477952 [Mycena olivaceomarginata]|nr:hypothetical protein B0H14DRAFT_3477952 [Mycena olivaceomarginata]